MGNQRYRDVIAIYASSSEYCYVTFGCKTRCAPSEDLDLMDNTDNEIDNTYMSIKEVYNFSERLTLDYETCDASGVPEQCWLWFFRNPTPEKRKYLFRDINKDYPKGSDGHDEEYHELCSQKHPVLLSF